jgi:hypothetical protein
MAKQIASQVGAWVKSVAAVEQADEGDILAPLRRVQTQYRKRGDKLFTAGRIESADYYYDAALKVGFLLGDSLALVAING